MEIPAHKMVLASCSPYFYAMFSGTEFEESHQDKIHVQGVEFQALQLLVDYVYTSYVDVTEDNVQVTHHFIIFINCVLINFDCVYLPIQTLLTAANLLQLTDVRDDCCDYLQSQLDPSNCLGVRDFADIHVCFIS